MFVVNFNEKLTLALPGATGFTDRADELERAVRTAQVDGQTAPYDAVIEGEEQLRAAGRDKNVLIVISDGGDNASSHTMAQTLKIAEESGAVVYTIGIFDKADEDSNPGELRRLAHVTRGDPFFPGQPDEVALVCERIAPDIRNQYTIGYDSADMMKPGSWQSIRVSAMTAGNNKLFVRALAGYIPGEPGLIKNEGAE